MGKTENLIPNDIDLRRLVGLLSYLKKSDDVEQELDKDSGPRSRPLGADPTSETARLLAGLGPTDRPISPAALDAARSSRTSVGSGTPGTTSGDIPTFSETPEGTEDPEGIIKPYKHYHSHGTETGPRQGKFDTVGDTPIESVTAPGPTGSDTSDSPSLDFPTDEEREVIQWFRDEGWTLADLQQAIKEFTKPASKMKGPQDYQRHSSFQKSRTKIVRKFNESDILNLFNRLGI